MAQSSARPRAALRRIHRDRGRLLRRLGQADELAIGTVSVVRRKCGKPGCHCADGAGHPQTLFLFKGDDGRRHCKLVRRQDEERLLRAGRRYREFRAARRQLRAINQREERVLVALMKARALKYE
ncbi:MAG: DUF6788 family protein [Candidatus Methylomirabilia bacterium]